MRIDGDAVAFDACDAAFVQKFGVSEATQMVLDYTAQNPLPFLYDPSQLADFLQINKRTLFYITRRAERFYQAIRIPKKHGGYRQLYAPIGALKACQTRIYRGILVHLPLSPYATAYRAGARIAGNAAPHIGKRYLLKLDIADFFGSIDFEQVYSAVFNTTRFPRQIGFMLTALCCRRGALVQGAPTSPALSNIVLYRFDMAIGSWCERRGIAYTRYCDDMTFSADRPLYPVYEKVQAMLDEAGFELNEAKTRFVNCNNRQTVTGLTVNEKLSVPAGYKRRLRQEVYYARKYGLADCLRHTGQAAFLTNGQPDIERYRRHLLGRIAFVLQTEPADRYFIEARNALLARAE